MCIDATGGGCGSQIIDTYKILPVRCTAEGCSVYVVDAKARLIDRPLRVTGKVTDTVNPSCAPSRWSVELRPVGRSTTEGVTHPARLVGTITANRPAEVQPGINCFGADEVYRYDATPS